MEEYLKEGTLIKKVKSQHAESEDDPIPSGSDIHPASSHSNHEELSSEDKRGKKETPKLP